MAGLPYRTTQFFLSSYALWQVVEIRTDLRFTILDASAAQKPARPSQIVDRKSTGAVAQLVER